tara:strand:- start:198 stop:383 length:186 start_codon:yes stop_codon:yes gene_type:complete
MNMKITEEELAGLSVWDIIFYTVDEEGNKKFWKTNHNIDHSSLCEGWEVDDLYYAEENEDE